MRKNLFIKISVAVVIHANFLSGPVFSAPPPNPEEIVIPKETGIIRSKFAGKTGSLVIHIQDAHCNYEAQSNIVKILESLIKNQDLSLIAVEGADGFIDTSWFKTFPDDSVRKQVAAYFMRKGQITGPEFLCITSASRVRLFGAETRSYYLENLNAFTSSYPLKEEAERYYNRIKNALTRLKPHIYSEDLKIFDVKFQDYESKKIPFNDYVRYLEEMAKEYRISLKEYDNFFKMTNVLLYEKKIDFRITNKERSDLIDELTKKITKNALTDLIEQSFSFKNELVSSTDYYSYLRDLAEKNDIDVAKNFPNLYNYTTYSTAYSKIENDRLFDDMKKIGLLIREKLFENDDQRTLDKLCRHIDILLGLVDIRLLNDDFGYYESHKNEFVHDIFASFVKKKSAEYGLAYSLEEPSDAVKKMIPKLEDFYLIARKRDKALVENTLDAMNKEGTRIAALITGGFHSEGIANLLKSQGIAYLIVCPSITKNEPTPYIQILTNQKMSFDDILTGAGPAKKGGALAPILISRFVSLTDGEIPAYFGQFRELAGAVLSRVRDVKDAWIKLAQARKMT